MEEGFFLEGTGQVFLFSISVNFSVLTKSLRSGEKKGFLALYIYIYQVVVSNIFIFTSVWGRCPI